MSENPQVVLQKDQPSNPTDYKNLYNILNQQNLAIAPTIQNTKDVYSTDDQKSQYQSAQNANLDTINIALYYVYYGLLVVVAYILIMKTTMNIYIRVGMAAMFVVYPFVINYIEYYLYVMYSYLQAVLNGNVYTSSAWK